MSKGVLGCCTATRWWLTEKEGGTACVSACQSNSVARSNLPPPHWVLRTSPHLSSQFQHVTTFRCTAIAICTNSLNFPFPHSRRFRSPRPHPCSVRHVTASYRSSHAPTPLRSLLTRHHLFHSAIMSSNSMPHFTKLNATNYPGGGCGEVEMAAMPCPKDSLASCREVLGSIPSHSRYHKPVVVA